MAEIQTDKYTIYDIETLINLSTFCFKDFATQKKKEFVIHESRNDFLELVRFLSALVKNKYYLVGFNSIDFDGQVINFILSHWEQMKDMPGDMISNLIYTKAQEVINTPEKERFSMLIPERNQYIMPIDLYKQKHYDGKAKRTSLKWLEFTMNLDNIEEMPVEHDQPVSKDGIQDVLSYNWNDVEATYEFFKRNKYETDLRLKLCEQFGLPLLNASEPRIAREVLAKLLAQDMGVDVRTLKERKTFRKEIHLGKCIIPIVKFEEQCFKDLVTKLKKTTINALNTKGCFEHSIKYKGIDIEYGVGGVHGTRKSGVFTSGEDYIIKTVDVTSFYPMMIINYGFAPAHLGKTFADRYLWFFNERKKYGKKDPLNYVYKIILNSTYGLSNDVNSFLYDTLTTMKTTINGQLLLTMLAESLSAIPDSMLIMMNTDGLEIKIPRKHEELFALKCKEWEDLTKLQLEGDKYEKMIIGDVNNYISVFTEREAKSKEDWLKLQKDEPYYIFREDSDRYFYSPVKMKGRFELKLDYHKNPSGLIIPKAVYNYFVKGIPVEKSVVDCDNIFDFCYGVKKKYDFKLVLHSVEKGEHKKVRQQKVTRYYVSTDGGKLVKEYDDGRIVSVNASALVTICNRISNHQIPLNLDRQYYIDEAYKELENIEGVKTNQLNLF
jgi:hypothetical protein